MKKDKIGYSNDRVDFSKIQKLREEVLKTKDGRDFFKALDICNNDKLRFKIYRTGYSLETVSYNQGFLDALHFIVENHSDIEKND